MIKVPLIQTQEISFERGGREIASKINIILNDGEIFFIKGKNGSGKTTLLKCLGGFVPISSGKILWNGREIFPIDNRGDPIVAWLGHQNALKSILSVKENLDFYADIWGVKNEIVQDSIKLLSFDKYLDFPVSWLSAGEKRRLSLIRLVFCPAKVWLLDEPSSFLDEYNKNKLKLIMENHVSSGGSIICSTHDNIKVSNSKTLVLG